MPQEPLTYEDLLRIVELIRGSEQFSEFRLKVGDIEIELKRRVPNGMPTPIAAATARASAASATPAQEVGAPLADASPADAPTWSDDAIVIRAPMVGTFYRAPEPGAPPFVEVGQSVDDHTIVCIIEVMKLMNSIPAGARGTVTHVLVADATPVQTGQPLIVLQPELPAP